MAIDMKLDVGAFIKGFTSRGKEGSASKSPYQGPLVIGVFVILLVIAYVFLIYIPGQKEIREKQAMIDSTDQLREELFVLDKELLLKQIELQDGKYRFEELSRLFHDKKELEDLYRNISLLALTYELMVVKLEKGEEVPVFKENVNSMDDGFEESTDSMMGGEGNYQDEEGSTVDGEKPKKEVAFYKINVKFNFSGDYLNYTYFRRDLAQLKKIINIEEETIKVPSADQGDGSAREGVVDITAALSTYRFPNTDAERYIVDDEWNQ